MRTMGASTARSVHAHQYRVQGVREESRTLARHSPAVDTGAANHDIVNDGETALAADPVTITVPDLAVGQNGSFVELDATTVEVLGERNLIRVEEVPAGPADDLIGSVSEDINDRVRGVKNASLAGEVCRSNGSA